MSSYYSAKNSLLDNIDELLDLVQSFGIETSNLDKEKLIKDKQQIVECKREFYLQNRESILERVSQYYQDNKEQRLAYAKAYRESHREKISAYLKEYYQQNKEKISSYQKTDVARQKQKEMKGCIIANNIINEIEKEYLLKLN